LRNLALWREAGKSPVPVWLLKLKPLHYPGPAIVLTYVLTTLVFNSPFIFALEDFPYFFFISSVMEFKIMFVIFYLAIYRNLKCAFHLLSNVKHMTEKKSKKAIGSKTQKEEEEKKKEKSSAFYHT